MKRLPKFEKVFGLQVARELFDVRLMDVFYYFTLRSEDISKTGKRVLGSERRALKAWSRLGGIYSRWHNGELPWFYDNGVYSLDPRFVRWVCALVNLDYNAAVKAAGK